MGTTRITLRSETKDQNGLCSLQLVYQIQGDRKRFATDFKAWPETWDKKNQQVIYLNKAKAKKLLPNVDYNLLPDEKEVTELNAKITALKKDVSDIEKYFELVGEEYTTTKVIERLKEKRNPLAKKSSNSNEVYHFIDKYIESHKATRKKGSLSVYSSLRTHLQEFQSQAKRKITFDGLDYNFFKDFQNFLLSPHKVYVPSKSKKQPNKPGTWKTVSLNNTTVAKQLSTLKTFIGYARKQGVKVNDKYKDFPIKKQNLEVIALTSDEFEKLYFMDLSNSKRLEQVRDVFCFSCVTGLRYSDLEQLRRIHIHDDEIRINVKKTEENLTVPLNDYAKAILAKYKDMQQPLPVLSNAKMNEYLKELCENAEIKEPVEIVRFRGSVREVNVYPKYKLISVHVGRKTFVTLSLERGMSAEEVMTITGHQDYKSFKRYVKVTEKRKKVVMAKAWKMEPKLKAV